MSGGFAVPQIFVPLFVPPGFWLLSSLMLASHLPYLFNGGAWLLLTLRASAQRLNALTDVPVVPALVLTSSAYKFLSPANAVAA